MNQTIKVLSPATVANVACGFDVLGFCLELTADEIIVTKTKEKGIRITKISGAELPSIAEQNVAGVSAIAMYNDLRPNCGFEIEITKCIKPGSGIGSSAASAAGSVYGMNILLGSPLNQQQLTYYAMKGEALASNSEHADNIAPCLFGGFTLVKSSHPLQILQLPTPADLFATVIHPQIEIKTSESRAILPKSIALKNAITQWANLGSLVHALHTQDYNLLSESLTDVVIEPHRKRLIPHYDDVKKNALSSGALGCSISGSGPSIFALSRGIDVAVAVEKAMASVYSNTFIKFETFVSKINTQGIRGEK